MGSGFTDDLATAGTIVGIVAAAGGLASGARSIWRRTIGARDHVARGVNRLVAGMPAEGVDALFGPCSLRSKHETTGTTQQIYLTKYACVDVLMEIDTHTVVGFSITATNPPLPLQHQYPDVRPR